MTNDELDKKRAKADIYAQEPERFMVVNLQLQMQSTHDMRSVRFEQGKWTCTCDFFKKQGTCSHVMAIQELLKHFRFDTSE
jgi:SWIM zinc finger